MKKLPKILFILMFIFSLSFSVTSCNKTTEKINSVKDVLEENNGKQIEVEGVIYYKTNDGFYLSSDDSYIYCINPKDESLLNYKIGDDVKITGYYSFFESIAKITNIESLEIISSDNGIIEAQEETIYNISLKDKSDKNFYSKYISLKGLVKKEEGKYYLTDAVNNKVEILNEVDDNLDKIVTANYVVSGYSDGFTLYRTTNAVEAAYTLSDLLPLIEIELNDNPRYVYDKLKLVTESTIEGVTYSYNFENESISTTEFNQVEEKTETKLSITINYNNETKVITKDITLMPNELMNVSDFLKAIPSANYSNCKLTGIVTAKLSNSSKSVYTLIVKDINTNDQIPLVFRSAKDENGNDLANNISPTDNKFLSISVGFTITFKARYNVTGDYKNTFDGVTELSNDGKIKTIDIDYDSAYILNDRDSYSNLSSNYEEYFGKLLKIEKPYLSYSASAGALASYVLPLYTKDSSAIYSSRISSIDEDGTITYKTLSFSTDANDLSYGDSSWRMMFDIAAKYYDYNKINADIYCYLVPSTGSRIQLVIPSKDYLKIYNEDGEYDSDYDKVTKINASLDQVINKYYYSNETISLPETIYNTAITYDKGTSYDVSLSDKSKQEVIKATYTVNNKNYTKDVIINVIGSNVIQVSQIRNYNDDSLIYAKGVVIGFASETLSSSDSSRREYKGLIVKDQYTSECIIVDGLEYNLEQTYPNFVVNNEELKIGSLVTFKGRYVKESSRITLRYDGEIKFVKNVDVEYYEDDFIVVNDTTSLSEAIYSIDSETREDEVMYARLIKLVGTESNPIYFTPTSSNEVKSSGKMNFRIHYNSKATAACDTMFDGYSITIKQDNQSKNANLEDTTWYESLGLPKIGTSGSMYPGAMAFKGEMYIVVCYKSSGSDGINCFYNSCSIVNFENWTLEEVESDSSIEYGD